MRPPPRGEAASQAGPCTLENTTCVGVKALVVEGTRCDAWPGRTKHLDREKSFANSGIALRPVSLGLSRRHAARLRITLLEAYETLLRTGCSECWTTIPCLAHS